MIPNNARHLRLTAAAGTELAVASFGGSHHAWLERLFSPPDRSLQPEGLRPPRGVLGQTFVHCQRFSTAASRRSLGSVSVPVCGITLSGPIPVVALVGRYPTNKLIRLGPLLEWKSPEGLPLSSGQDASTGSYAVLIHLSVGYPPLEGRLSKHSSPFRHFNRSP